MIWHILLRTVAILITSYITHVGVPILFSFQTPWIALLVALVLAVINHTIKPALTLVLIPVHLLTLGLSSLLVNGLMIIVASHLVPGFIIPTIIMGIWFSFVLSVVNWLLHIFE